MSCIEKENDPLGHKFGCVMKSDLSANQINNRFVFNEPRLLYIYNLVTKLQERPAHKRRC